MMTGKPAAVQKTRLLVFTRCPLPGRTKTRLIPYLGEQGAALLQTRMMRHTLAVASIWRQTRPVAIEVWFAGGDAELMRQALGDSFVYSPQQGADLGSRLRSAFHHAFSSGAQRVLCIGSDCPELTPELLAEATDGLESHDVVLGPAVDGGYYLIGMRRPQPSLFEQIDWGTDRVLQQTVDRVRSRSLSLMRLPALTDVDTWRTLPAWHRRCQVESSGCRYSVIVPTLNEEASIRQLLESIGSSRDTEIVVADGGSEDATREIASQAGALVVPTPRGRGLQMNCGAAMATGDVLLFLHGDTRLPSSWRSDLDRWNESDSQAGAFLLRFDDPAAALRWIARAANWRSRRLQLPYGDQCLFVRREAFGLLNGFRHLPIMEDVDFVRRWRRHGRWTILPSHVITSARKYRRHGVWRTVARHQWVLLRHWKQIGSIGEPHAEDEAECHSGQ